MSAPDPGHPAVFKCVPKQLLSRFRHDSLTPVGLPEPVAEFTFIRCRNHIRISQQLQLDCANRFSIRFQPDRIQFLFRIEKPDNLQAFFCRLMRRPAGNRPDCRILCILKHLFCLRFFPGAENQPFRFKFHISAPFSFMVLHRYIGRKKWHSVLKCHSGITYILKITSKRFRPRSGRILRNPQLRFRRDGCRRVRRR